MMTAQGTWSITETLCSKADSPIHYYILYRPSKLGGFFNFRCIVAEMSPVYVVRKGATTQKANSTTQKERKVEIPTTQKKKLLPKRQKNTTQNEEFQ